MIKNKIIIFIGIIITLACAFNSCKKYPEDKFISLRKPSKRIDASWKIKEYTFNGNDVIDVINSQTKTFDVRDLILEVIMKDKFGNSDEPRYRFSPASFLGAGTTNGNPLGDNNSTFYFGNSFNQNNKGDSLINYIFITPLNYKGSKYSIPWDIKKLYLSKMHLQLKTDSGNYDIHFEKK